MCLFRDYLVIVTPVSVLIQDLSSGKERGGGLIDSFAGSEHLYYDCPSHQPGDTVIHCPVPPGTQQLPTPENIQWNVFSVSVVLKSLDEKSRICTRRVYLFFAM